MVDDTKNDRPSRILIVDDHPIVRKGMRQLLEDEPDLSVAGEAADAAAALRFFEKETPPDLAVVDISLEKGIGGIELVKELKARFPDVKILVSSMHDENLYAERCLSAGALGYINKQAAPERLVAAVRRVLAGKVYVSEALADRFLGRMVSGEDAMKKSAVESLSDRELEVFEMIGKGMTTRAIAENLHLSVKTIETYRENIKGKLNLTNSAELMRHAVQWTLENR